MANRTPLKDVALNSWTEENKDAKYPQYIYGDPNKATQTSSRFLYSSNFLRISNMTLGYTVPVNLTKKIFIQNYELIYPLIIYIHLHPMILLGIILKPIPMV